MQKESFAEMLWEYKPVPEYNQTEWQENSLWDMPKSEPIMSYVAVCMECDTHKKAQTGWPEYMKG